MKASLFTSILLLSISLSPLHAEKTSDIMPNSEKRYVQPYSREFSYTALSPVNIETESFSLLADSGSLQHDLAIQLSVISYKGGTLMPSNMENVCRLSDGVRLLPNGKHFADSIPALKQKKEIL